MSSRRALVIVPAVSLSTMRPAPGQPTDLAVYPAVPSQKTVKRQRAVVLLHIADRSELLWIPPIVQRAKVESFTKDHGFELVEILSDGFEGAENPTLFNRAFQMLEDGKVEVLLPLKLEGGQVVPWDPKAG